MESKNYLHHSLILTFVVFILLFIFSSFNSQFNLFGYSFRKINITSDLTKEPKFPPAELYADLMPEDTTIVKDKKTPKAKNELQNDEGSQLVFVYNGENTLNNFFTALKSTEEKKTITRIAYFGDSMIEGDLITQTFRDSLQKKFGGKGVGFVNITSVVSGFRRTIKHTFSGNWDAYNITQPKKGKEYGLSGYVFSPTHNIKADDTTNAFKNASWVAYQSVAYNARLNKFDEAYLYYGKTPKHASVQCEIDKNLSNFSLKGKNQVNELAVFKGKNVNNLTTKFAVDSNFNVYGMSFQSSSGVIVDNFSLRGNSGVSMSHIPGNVMREFNSFMHYDLVILQFGTNISDTSIKDYGWYKKAMMSVVNQIKTNMPTADVLIVSAADRSYKEETDFTSIPSIPRLVNSQKQLAKENNIAFFNLYEAMGGYNSMITWVEKGLANKDYTHVNGSGANRISNMLYRQLMEQYKLFKK